MSKTPSSTQPTEVVTGEHVDVEAIPISERQTDEIVVALVGLVGSGVSFTANILSSLLTGEFGYNGRTIKLSDIINSSSKTVKKSPVDPSDKRRTFSLQDIGNTLRKEFGSRFLAELAIRDINTNRGIINGAPKARRYFTIIDSIKNPDEVAALRQVYGDALWVIGVFAPESIRKRRLHAMGHDDPYISEIFNRDEADGFDHGQNVRGSMELSDFFVRNDADNDAKLRIALSRFLEIVFSVVLHTPSRDEVAMHAATSMAAASACMSRQVGAVITNDKGEIIGQGMNDVPKFGGGLYTSDDKDNDHRCFKWKNKECHNDRCKKELLRRVERNLAEIGVLKKGRGDAAIESVRKAGVKDLIEFSRSVHAEMEAIISVARTGKMGLVGGTLYTRTFPCHNCARHIVASGINRVVYIEPYTKSQALDLHDDSLSVDEKDLGRKVVILQFEGVAPKNLLRLFIDSRERKRDGRLALRSRVSASPISQVPLDGFVTREQLIVASLAGRRP